MVVRGTVGRDFQLTTPVSLYDLHFHPETMAEDRKSVDEIVEHANRVFSVPRSEVETELEDLRRKGEEYELRTDILRTT